jgi:DNA polymerase-1
MTKNKYSNLLNNIVKEQDEAPLKIHDRVLLIDGLNLFFRNFAVLNYINDNGAHIGGLSGFLRSLGYLIKQFQPTSVYVIFDGPGSTINRKNILSEYKESRDTLRVNWDVFDDKSDEDESKYNQLVRLTHYLQCLPIKVISLDKVEADDIIAFLAQKLSKKYDSKVIITSSDKDFLQLINDNINVFRPIEKKVYTPQTVFDEFGVLPTNFILYKTLIGDSSDKIKGVKGLGKKKIPKLFPELSVVPQTLDDIFNKCEQNYKENLIYSKIILNFNEIQKYFKIMNLHDPMIDDKGKEYLDEQIIEPITPLRPKEFNELYNKDGIGKVIRNVDFWLKEVFEKLQKYKL